MKTIIISLSVLAIIVGGIVYSLSPPTLPAIVTQPILFNHPRHEEKDVACYDCHLFYKDYAVAGIPDTELCFSCHKSDKDLKEKEEKRKLHQYFTNKTEINWQRINTPLPADVVFDHKRHVVKEIDCYECHGKIEQQVETMRMVEDFTMDKCVECHLREKASDDCLVCHK
jgi:c(7)-type cytochrome triheme protein